MWKTGNHLNSGKIYSHEKSSEDDLFIELFANVKRLSLKTFIRACELLNERKKMRKF